MANLIMILLGMGLVVFGGICPADDKLGRRIKYISLTAGFFLWFWGGNLQ